MKNTVEAVRYGIETLKVSPEQMFALIESSEGYEGEDYKRWLAREIIKLADKDGVGYSQLLVKKFSIIQSLIEDYSNDDIKPEWISFFSSKLGGEDANIFAVDIDGVGSKLEDVDWFSGIDLDEINSVFVENNLPEEVGKCFTSDDNVRFFMKLSSSSSDKNCELFKDAKLRGITCKNEGSLMLYRMCSMLETYESCTDNFMFAFLTSTQFLYDSENKDIINYLLSYYHCIGVSIKSTELLSSSYTSGNYAFVICHPRRVEDEIQDGIRLKVASLSDGKVTLGDIKRYSRSNRSMFEYLKAVAPKCKDVVPYENGDMIDGSGKGLATAYGYLNYDRRYNTYLSSLPMKGMSAIPIVDANLDSIIVFYAVSKSMQNFGMCSNIKEIITGHEGYKELLYNCVPLFLFDIDSKFCGHGVLRENGKIIPLDNKFDIKTSDLVETLLEKGEVYFSFEAKQLIDICKGFLDFLDLERNGYVVGKTFEQVRKEANHEELNKSYMTALNNMKDYVSTLYRKME